MSLNRSTIIGHLGQHPQLRFTNAVLRYARSVSLRMRATSIKPRASVRKLSNGTG